MIYLLPLHELPRPLIKSFSLARHIWSEISISTVLTLHRFSATKATHVQGAPTCLERLELTTRHVLETN